MRKIGNKPHNNLTKVYVAWAARYKHTINVTVVDKLLKFFMNYCYFSNNQDKMIIRKKLVYAKEKARPVA